ncbi:glycosyltransferase involved in cell wall biosynthesis [Bradyrhizobium sp. AZCC 2262]|uniref:glycosyltransferase family 4 protein n=1 Tax=Bradyrhizobium sp. AZCC 2262 TaxID=3117022 RepID=UPI002FEFF10D
MLQAPLLRVLIATPFGARQRGGIDRLTDLIVDTVENSADGRVRVDRLVTRGTGSLVWAPFVFGRALVRFWKLKRRGEVDLLHINLAAGGSAIRKAFLARFARRLGVPYVLHLHGSRFHQFWPSAGPYVRNLVDRMFAESAAIIVLGKYWSQLVTTHVPQVEKKITVLPNATAPIRLAREPAADGRVRISFLGELGQRKGTPQLVEALGRLVSRQDWTATIAGNGKVQETIARTQQLGIDDRVKVPGWLDSAAINEVLGQTDIFVLPSFAENLPMSILEAFACGIAVIATPVGAVEDVITHESNGLLVPVGDVDALASAIRRLIEDGTLREALGAAAQRDHARHYEIGAYISRLTTIWFNAADSVNRRKCA